MVYTDMYAGSVPRYRERNTGMALLEIKVLDGEDRQVLSLHEVSIDEVDKWWCEECEKGFEKEDTEPKYECQSCGEFTRSGSADGDSNRCPECNKFGAATGEMVCLECGGDTDIETCGVCPNCDEWIALSVLAGHVIECG
jgi:hypothetical protein